MTTLQGRTSLYNGFKRIISVHANENNGHYTDAYQQSFKNQITTEKYQHLISVDK